MSETTPRLTVRDWTPIDSGSAVLGSCTVELPLMRIKKVLILKNSNGGEPWALVPAIPMLDKEGRAMLQGNGKRSYSPVIVWNSRSIAARFSRAVCDAIRAQGVPL